MTDKEIILYNDDCINVLKKINSETIDCVITSPPYDNLRTYNNTLKWDFNTFKEIAKELFRVLKKSGVIIWVVADATIKGSETGTSFSQALYFKRLGLNLHDTMIYAKNNYIPKTHNRYEQAFEYMFCFSKGKPKTFNPIKIPCITAGSFRNRGGAKEDGNKCCERKRAERTITKSDKIAPNIFYYNVGTNAKNNHPAVFPLDLVKDQIKSWSNENDTVLDPFMGSGTTGIACKELNRNFIGIEIVKDYFDYAERIINDR